MRLSFIFILLFFYSISYAQQQDSVVIRGRVTDYNKQPIDSVSICWQRPDFSIATKTLTNKDGYYTARIQKGKYQSVVAIYWPSYPRFASSNLSKADQRLEFWAWDVIADRDTIFNFQYNRMEAYGLHAFRIPGAKPTYQIYVRPMSLTRAQNLADKKSPIQQLAPHANKLKVVVWIDNEEVPVLMKQEIKEYADTNQCFNAYLLTVNMPRKETKNTYRIFKVELTDLENGDRGEGLYYMEKEKYYK